MTKAIWLLCILLLINWIIQWKLTEWKVKEVQKASEHIEKKIDDVLLQYMQAEVLERAKRHIHVR